MEAPAIKRSSIESELRSALDRNELELYYQPTIDLETGTISGAEALMRWRHPERGLIPPDQFIPAAEASGLIIPMGRWALREACRQAKAWQDAGLPADSDRRQCVGAAVPYRRLPRGHPALPAGDATCRRGSSSSS